MLYDKVKEIADTKGISIYKLEKEANLSKGSICKWNKNIPSVDKIQRVAKILSVKVDKLIS